MMILGANNLNVLGDIVNTGSLSMNVGGSVTVKNKVTNMGSLAVNTLSMTVGSGIAFLGDQPSVFSVGTYAGTIEGTGTVFVRRNVDNWNVRALNVGLDVVVEGV
jgi:hypothetical protein